MDYKEMNAIGIVRLMLTDGVITEEIAGKYFPELKESEDEKIRESLLEYLHTLPNHYAHSGVCAPEWIAWLEKLGGHAKFINGIQVGDKVTRNEDGVLVNLSQLKRVAKKDEKQGEQKSNPCDGCINRKGCINCENGELREVEQKPAWSEEDEENLTNCIEAINLNYKWDNMVDWLKSLKDRYVWKPSESDILLLERIANGKSNPQDFQASLGGLIGKLKKLREE